MRRALGYLTIFVLGGVLAFALLQAYQGSRLASGDQARRTVLQILDRTPARAGVGDDTLIRAAARIEPAVVNIDTLVDVYGNPFERSYTLQGKGSGVIISPDGYVATNNHVIENASVIRVTTNNGKRYEGRLVGADADADIAVLKVDAAHLPAAEIGDSDRLMVGEYVLAIGNPLGIGITVTHGIISATDRRNLAVGEGRVLRRALQTDAPINRGNSGGALANTAGQLIGINTAIASEGGGGNIGIGFAIPSNAARGILKTLIAEARPGPSSPALPFIGVQFMGLPADMAIQYNVPPGEGIVVMGVVPLSPAESAGLKRGDVIVAIDGKAIASPDDFRSVLTHHKVGERVTLQLLRGDGSRDTVQVTIGRRPTRAAR